ncbi:26892_t:CDS:1 [Gigaspora margarita]|uniref:26892_t:CDS:1 n=1 Tax=Gigaspora margarita TaxID=4874 RepID=A0ABN7VDM5_GIGMA|nr:26892_t:CDS:1 [Gigaspora margarita]
MKEETTCSSSHGAMFLNFINGTYECVNSNKNDYLLDNDSTSFVSESTVNDSEIEISPFVLDKLSYKQSHIMANINKNKKITWEDIEAENEDDAILVLNSELTESSEYLIDYISSQSLTSCILIDIIDSSIECCLNKTEK